MSTPEERIVSILGNGDVVNLDALSKRSEVPIYLTKSIAEKLANTGMVRSFAREQASGAPLYEWTGD